METLATQCMHPFDKKSSRSTYNDFHFGGYAKTNAKLDDFVKNFNEKSNFNIEPIYTGKVMYALNEYIKDNDLRNQSNFVHPYRGIEQILIYNILSLLFEFLYRCRVFKYISNAPKLLVA